ncbi:MAG: hypothetical protein LIP02_09030 [Bacteroidales bacterium]|nr:hypothetical protein [Bacteroidales bacterium]
MVITISQTEMLALWRQLRYNEPIRNDAAVTRVDGVDRDRFHRVEMRNWYLNLLATGDLRYLKISDIASQVAVTSMGDGTGRVLLPERCVRPLWVMLEGWNRAARVVEPQSLEAEMQLNDYSRGGAVDPVAVHYPGHLRLYSLVDGVIPKISTLRCIIEPDDGVFELDESALSTIPPLL